jgi:predicted metal-binding membrane protein
MRKPDGAEAAAHGEYTLIDRPHRLVMNWSDYRPWQASRRRLDRGVPTTIAAAILVTWIVTVDRMQGMDAGPGTNLGGLGWFVGVWATMMAAMMLPSAMPTALVFAHVSAEHQRRGRALVRTWVFIAGYLAAWTAYGLLAYGVFRAIQSAHIHALSWHAEGPLIAGSAIVAAGAYQLSSLKRRCLWHCRSSSRDIVGGGRPGWSGAVRTGYEQGAFCIGCCGGLMLILFALGVMSITWMLVIAGLIFGEKVLPFGERLSRVFAVAFVLVGVWVAAAPSSVPGLTQPGSARAMRAMQAMGTHGANTGMGIHDTHGAGTQKTNRPGARRSVSITLK